MYCLYKTSLFLSSNDIGECAELYIHEKDVAITKYLNDFEGFQAVVKARFSDFHVHEIDMSNRVLRLNNFTIPVEPTMTDQDFKRLRESFSSLIDDEDWTIIEQKALNLQKNTNSDIIKIDVTNFDKMQRTNLHKIIKNKYSKLHSATVTESEHDGKGPIDKKYIQVTRTNSQPGKCGTPM